jgi:hypothetical protein
MAELAPERNLLVVAALGTFHATALVVALVLVLYATGALPSLLTSLSTIAGLALFSALWLTTVWSAHRTLRGAFTATLRTSLPVRTMIERATWNGGVNGVAFLAFLGLILAISSGINGALGIVIFGALFFATLGAAAAFVLGCLFGLLFVAIDIALVTASHAILDDSGKRLS